MRSTHEPTPNTAQANEPAVLLLDDAGAVIAATACATRLLELATRPHDVAAALRALRARAGSPHQRHAVHSLPAACTGRIILRAARAGRYLAVTVEAETFRDDDLPYTLTPREREVVRLTLQGLPTKLVALELAISPWTVTAHLRSIYDKCGVANRSQLAALALGAARAAG